MLVIACLVIIGSLECFTAAPLGFFDLDGEGTIPAGFSGALVFAAALVALAIARSGSGDQAERRTLWMIAGFFVFMGIDEGVMIHERVGTALGTHWQIPYLPVVAIAAVLWWRVLRILTVDPLAVRLWIAGAATWVGAQAFEIMQSALAPQHEAADGTVLPLHGAFNLHFVFTIVEEMVEMIGSSLFLFALLIFLRDRISTRTKRRRTHIAAPPEEAIPGASRVPV